MVPISKSKAVHYLPIIIKSHHHPPVSNYYNIYTYVLQTIPFQQSVLEDLNVSLVVHKSKKMHEIKYCITIRNLNKTNKIYHLMYRFMSQIGGAGGGGECGGMAHANLNPEFSGHHH